MTHLLSLGAINKLTGEYVYPKIANKKDEYICPECNKDLILCQGEIRVHHFRHKVDSNPCNHYNSPGESQIHKDAKMLLKTLLERKIPLSFIRKCCSCKENEEFEIPEISETSVIQLEYRFEYNGVKIADVAYIDDDSEFLCIFEICNTHKTCSENRPEPWFEIDAETLIKMANDNRLTSLQIPCIRCEKCDDCIETEEKRLKIKNLEEQKKFYNECIITEQTLADTIIAWGMTKEEKSTRRKHANAIKKYRDKIKIIDEELDILMGINKPILTKQEKLDRLEQGYRGDIVNLQKKPVYRFTKNDVDFTLSNNVFDIIHPLTKQKIKMSNTKKRYDRNVFINGKWHIYKCWRIYEACSITLDIINWYHNKPIIRTDFRNDLTLTFTSNQHTIEDKVDYDTSKLNMSLNAKNKTQRRKFLSEYLQSNEVGELNNIDMASFIEIYDKFYDNNNKINIDDIQKISIERGEYNSKCFNAMVDNNKHIISIKRFN